ncbi:hypothetical protein ACWC9T_25645 [Kitasatospora sp. NPDC001159]
MDIDVATGAWPDMTEHGWDTDEWPVIYSKVMAANTPRLARSRLTPIRVAFPEARLAGSTPTRLPIAVPLF